MMWQSTHNQYPEFLPILHALPSNWWTAGQVNLTLLLGSRIPFGHIHICSLILPHKWMFQQVSILWSVSVILCKAETKCKRVMGKHHTKCVHMHTHARACMHTHAHTHARARAHTHTHTQFNPLNPELNHICYLLALLGAHHFSTLAG